MKQIEERGGDFAANYEILDDNGRRKNECEIARESYISGAKCEHELLTRWHDPKDFMPEANKNVLVKCSSGEIQTDFYAPELGGFFIEHSTHAKVTGWREMM